jgi:reductive dehalogenase
MTVHHLLYLLALIFFVLFHYAALVSYREKEARAARRFISLAFVLPLPFLAGGWFLESAVLSWALVLLFVLAAGIFFFPSMKAKQPEGIVPRGRIDERDTMFSRDILEPGTDRYERYYSRHPECKPGDDAFRGNPGLLSPRAAYYDQRSFALARAHFELIERNRSFVDGPVAAGQEKIDPQVFSAFLRETAIRYGAVSAGITRLYDYHLYAYRGRRHNYGESVVNDHTWALALTVEMDHDFVRNAPYGLAVLESSRQYLRSGMLALSLAEMIRDLGYPARAHIDGEYEVVCPLVARDAGLGEIGRMGLLMTPELGPRVRIAVVTTSMPLIPDERKEDPAMIDFCTRCKKCAQVCPSRAIPFDDRRRINGVLRWQIDQQACFTTWTKFGTDCARCMSVCPYSHPDNPLHDVVRYGIKNSAPFRNLAVKMDDFVYGRKPRPLRLPEWYAPQGRQKMV